MEGKEIERLTKLKKVNIGPKREPEQTYIVVRKKEEGPEVRNGKRDEMRRG